MNQYYVLVKFSMDTGSGFNKMFVTADNPYQAIQMARALFGPLLISESAVPV